MHGQDRTAVVLSDRHRSSWVKETQWLGKAHLAELFNAPETRTSSAAVSSGTWGAGRIMAQATWKPITYACTSAAAHDVPGAVHAAMKRLLLFFPALAVWRVWPEGGGRESRGEIVHFTGGNVSLNMSEWTYEKGKRSGAGWRQFSPVTLASLQLLCFDYGRGKAGQAGTGAVTQ